MKDRRAIYIISAGRPTKPFTLEKLPPKYRKMTKVIVPTGQFKAYSRGYGDIPIVECSENTIGRTRQWLIENTLASRIVMLDDDLYFFHRKEKGSHYLEKNTFEDTESMFDKLFVYLDEVPHAGIAPRTEASFYLCESRYCTRVNNVHAFDVGRMQKYARKYHARFDRMKVMEDFNVTLTLLRQGVPNRVMLDYVWNQPGSNTEGGCSTYRTAEVQAKAARVLHKLHPDFVKVVKKKVIGKTSWDGMKERTDVRVRWHDAYLSGTGGIPHKHWKKESGAKRNAK